LYTNETCMNRCVAQANATAWSDLSPEILQKAQSCHWCKDWSGGDTLFDHIMQLHEGHPVASALDAGTGASSLHWVSQVLRPKQWTAVTATEKMAERMQSVKLRRNMREGDEVLVGNWKNTTFLEGKKYDLVLADYLVGAVEGHAPYFQEQLFTRLKEHMAKDGRLYVVGKDPTPHPRRYAYSDKPAFHIYHGIHQVEDIDNLVRACINHVNHRAYREYPLEWVIEMARRAGLKVESQRAFPVIYGSKALHQQLDVCENKLSNIEGRHLLNGITERIAQLRQRVDENPMINTNGVCYGVDYVVALSIPN